jgi:hypothetical protein
VASLRLVPIALCSLAVVAAVACSGGSPGDTDAGSFDATVSPDGADGGAGPESGMTCLLCNDASEDASIVTQVRGEIDRVCSNMDGCHGAGEAHMTLLPGS